jgi:hypothetical protein
MGLPKYWQTLVIYTAIATNVGHHTFKKVYCQNIEFLRKF